MNGQLQYYKYDYFKVAQNTLQPYHYIDIWLAVKMRCNQFGRPTVETPPKVILLSYTRVRKQATAAVDRHPQLLQQL